MIRKTYSLLPLVVFAVPLLAAAATIGDIIDAISELVNLIIPLLTIIAIAVFLYGVVRYILAGGDAAKEAEARRYLIAGLVGLFVLVAFWALITVLTSTFGLTEEEAPLKPSFQPPLS